MMLTMGGCVGRPVARASTPVGTPTHPTSTSVISHANCVICAEPYSPTIAGIECQCCRQQLCGDCFTRLPRKHCPFCRAPYSHRNDPVPEGDEPSLPEHGLAMRGLWIYVRGHEHLHWRGIR